MKGSLADGARFGFRQKEFASLPSHGFAPATNCTYERTIDGREYANGTKEEKEKKGMLFRGMVFWVRVKRKTRKRRSAEQVYFG